MSSPLLDRIATISRAILRQVSSTYFPTDYRIQTLQHDERFLILQSGNRKVTFDQRYQTVKVGMKTVATYDAIQSVEVKDGDSGDGPSVWEVSLYLSWRSRIRIGKSSDTVEASKVAGLISTMTGKKLITF